MAQAWQNVGIFAIRIGQRDSAPRIVTGPGLEDAAGNPRNARLSTPGRVLPGVFLWNHWHLGELTGTLSMLSNHGGRMSQMRIKFGMGLPGPFVLTSGRRHRPAGTIRSLVVLFFLAYIAVAWSWAGALFLVLVAAGAVLLFNYWRRQINNDNDGKQ